MQIKTTRYHLIAIIMAIIRKTRDSKCWGGCVENGILYNVDGIMNQYIHDEKKYDGS